MRSRNKQNMQISSNMHHVYDQIPAFGHTTDLKDHFSSKQISPIRKNKISQSQVSNAHQFQQFARSTSSITNPLSQMYNPTPRMHVNLNNQRFSNTHRNIQIANHLMEDPQVENQWKSRYHELYQKYEISQKKLQNKIKENSKLHNTIADQSNSIKQLNEQNLQLKCRCSNLMEQKNRWAGSVQSSFMSANQEVNPNQFNRYYIQELQRKVDNLQRENKRLSDIIKRNMRNCFQY